MILHPGILALLLGSFLVLLLMVVSTRIALQVLCRWDPLKSDEGQLSLERRTYLVSTLVNYALGFTIFSLPLFLYTIDDLHPLFTGAMCATGSLNANPIGWWALITKLVLVLLAGLWVVLNHYDLLAEDYPLVKVKYLALLVLMPLVIADLGLQVAYFTGLNPEIITSCCGSLFSANSDGVASELVSLPPKSMMIVFYSGLVAFLGLLAANLLSRLPLLRYLLALFAGCFLLLGLAAIVSFISLYIYELPTHHCPFDMLQKSSDFIGYPIYLGLFGASLCGLVPAMLEMMRRIPSLSQTVVSAQRRWLWMTLFFLSLFVALTTWSIVFSRLTLQAYF
jgi:hypothetical protein